MNWNTIRRAGEKSSPARIKPGLSFCSTPLSALALLVSLGSVTTALAAPVAVPDAGQSLQQMQSTPPPSAGPATPSPLAAPSGESTGQTGQATNAPHTHLSHLVFTGNTAFSSAILNRVAGNLHDQDVTLADLQAAADKVTHYYRAHGYLVARAYLPQQEVNNGEIRIAVLEGTLSATQTHNTSRVSSRLVNGILSHQLHTGQPLRSGPANRALLLLQALPGVASVQGSLHPGSGVGSTALNVAVTPASRANGQIGLDNYGNRYTGRNRLTGSLNLPNLLGIGDQLSVQGAISERNDLDYGRLSWDAPVGYDGLRLGAALSNTRYNLGDAFSSLDAHGTARTAALYGDYPLILAPGHSLKLGLSLEHRQLTDITGAVNENNHKQANVAVLTLSGDSHDSLLGGGANAWRLANTVGNLTLNAQAAQQDQLARTAGHYDKLVLSGSRLQALPSRFSLYLAGSVQWASKNLDSSEKFFLGGANGVRAYPQGEASGDEGWLVNLALRYQIEPGLQVKVFQDEGGVTINRNPYLVGQGNHRHLSGTGLGLDVASLAHHVTLDMAVAWRNGTGLPTSDTYSNNPLFWIQGAYHF